MSLHKYALIRYRIIDGLIRNKYQPYPDIERLRSQCEESLFGSDYGAHISISTIEKDLRAMREDMELGYNAPIKYSRSYKGYYYTDPEYTIQKIPLNNDDVDAIKLAANTLFNFRESPVFAQFKFAIEKIFDRLNISEEVLDDQLDELVQFDSFPEFPGNEHLAPIYEAITQKKTLNISYQRFNNSTLSTRSINPYLLKEYKYRWYVIAYDHKRNKVLTFSLDRIKKLESTDETFVSDAAFNAKDFFRYAFGITESSTNPVVIKLKFSIDQLGYFQTVPIHSSQEITVNDDHFIIRIMVVPSFELYEQLLSYGNRVQIIQPKAVRDKLVKLYKEALEKNT